MNAFVPVLCIFAVVSSAVAFKSDVCLLEPFKGGDHDINCLMNELLWTYDYSLNRCFEFVYGGCGGNENRFYSREECEDACKYTDPCVMETYTDSAYDNINCLMTSEFWSWDVCQEQPFSGSEYYGLYCYLDIPSWTYVAGTCVEYRYGGCSGNGNRFTSLTQCQNTCMN